MNEEHHEDSFLDDDHPKVAITLYIGNSGPRQFILYRSGMTNDEWCEVFHPVSSEVQFTDIDGNSVYVKNEVISAVVVTSA